MLKPICVPCQRFFRPERNGLPFIEGMPTGDGRAPLGTERPDLWKPYKLWQGDLWRCHGCGAQIVVGTGRVPVSMHHEPSFGAEVARFAPTLTVNDC